MNNGKEQRRKERGSAAVPVVFLIALIAVSTALLAGISGTAFSAARLSVELEDAAVCESQFTRAVALLSARSARTVYWSESVKAIEESVNIRTGALVRIWDASSQANLNWIDPQILRRLSPSPRAAQTVARFEEYRETHGPADRLPALLQMLGSEWEAGREMAHQDGFLLPGRSCTPLFSAFGPASIHTASVERLAFLIEQWQEQPDSGAARLAAVSLKNASGTGNVEQARLPSGSAARKAVDAGVLFVGPTVNVNFCDTRLLKALLESAGWSGSDAAAAAQGISSARGEGAITPSMLHLILSRGGSGAGGASGPALAIGTETVAWRIEVISERHVIRATLVKTGGNRSSSTLCILTKKVSPR